MFGEWGYPDNPGLSRIIQILDNPGYVWIYPDNTRLRNGGGGGGRGGGADAEHRIKLPPAAGVTPATFQAARTTGAIWTALASARESCNIEYDKVVLNMAKADSRSSGDSFQFNSNAQSIVGFAHANAPRWS